MHYITIADIGYSVYLGPSGFPAPKHIQLIWLSNMLGLRVHDECYSSNASCALYLSEWVIVVYANSAIFQLYHGENKLIFNEMMMRSALY